MTTHTIKRGYDIRLSGRPEPALADAPEPLQVAVETAEFPGIKPKPLVKEGDRVATGQPLILDKRDRTTVWCSPATGTVLRVELGERRFLKRIVVQPQGNDEFHAVPKAPLSGSREEMVAALMGAGLWPLLRQRPIGKMPGADIEPVAVFLNGMDTEPLAADPAFAVRGQKDDLQAGVQVLQRLCRGKIYLALRAAGDHQSDLRDLQGVEVHDFAGPHPAGLVGTHIARIRPLKQGETALALRLQDLVLLGEWARTGRYPCKRVVAVGGSHAPARKYFRVRQGAQLAALCGGAPVEGDLRVINGTVLNGRAVPADGFLGVRNSTVTIIPEGTGERDLFGWALPQFGKLSFHRSVMGWLTPKKDYVLDARLNGGPRPIVNIGAWESVTPLDIHPTYLVRAIQANDIEEAIKLGLLDVTEEDVALCTFVDPCKIDVGAIVREGLDLYEKES
ncbi:MAG: Na(+)-translocating NADH-quinone reductase subunit A [Planctomycetota bacterium]